MALAMYHDKGMNIQEYESYNGNDDIEQARYSSRSNNNYNNNSSSRNINNNSMKRTSNNNNINNVGRDTTNNNPRQIHPLNSTKTGYHPTGAPGQPPHSNLNSHKLPTDIDTFQTSSEKLSSILKVADVQLHQHQLTIDYYTIRKYSLLLPTILMALVISILGFIAASNLMEDPTLKVHDTTLQEFLIILVSSFAFLILLFVIINNQLDYSTKIAFHTSTVNDLRLLIEKIKYYKIERSLDERNKEYDDELEEMFKEEEKDKESVVSDVLSDDDDDQLIPTGENALIPHTGQALIQLKQQKKAAKLQAKQIAHNKQKIERHKSKLTTNLVKQKVRQARQQQDITKDTITFYGYHTELSSILSSCKNEIPAHITQFFVIMENRIELMSLSRLGVQGEGGSGEEEDNSRMRKNQIVRLASNEIYNEISNYILWPILTPSIDKTIETSLKNVGQLLNMNHRPSKRCKLIPCCPSITLPCFKKKTSSNIFAIINEGIDQRELDLMQIERMELMRMENDKRQRMNAGPEEIVEMKDTNVDKYGKNSRGGYGRDSRGYGGGRSRAGRSMRSEASTFADVATEVSYNSRSYYSRGGRYSSRGGGRMGSRGGGRSRGGGMYHDDDMMTEQGDVSRYTEDRSRYTEDRSRYTEDQRSRFTEDQRSRFTEEQSRGMGGGPGGGGGGDVRGMMQGEDEYGTDGTGTDGDYTDEEDELGAKKKKKKSKKSKKKKKKKDKKKEKKVDDEEFMDEEEFIEEEYGEEDYGEEEYDEVYDEYDDEENAQYVEGDFQEEVSQMEDEIYSEYSEMEE